MTRDASIRMMSSPSPSMTARSHPRTNSPPPSSLSVLRGGVAIAGSMLSLPIPGDLSPGPYLLCVGTAQERHASGQRLLHLLLPDELGPTDTHSPRAPSGELLCCCRCRPWVGPALLLSPLVSPLVSPRITLVLDVPAEESRPGLSRYPGSMPADCCRPAMSHECVAATEACFRRL